ncbi:hypothetical protein CF166_35455 [Amycolatopsis sp. KNN50.9b]|nr:hypothetical protein CF166_35455 [Amycolatopsis sp. KNN50.9b]
MHASAGLEGVEFVGSSDRLRRLTTAHPLMIRQEIRVAEDPIAQGGIAALTRQGETWTQR